MTKGVFLYDLYLASTVAHYVLEIVETDCQSSGKLSTHRISPTVYPPTCLFPSVLSPPSPSTSSPPTPCPRADMMEGVELPAVIRYPSLTIPCGTRDRYPLAPGARSCPWTRRASFVSCCNSHSLAAYAEAPFIILADGLCQDTGLVHLRHSISGLGLGRSLNVSHQLLLERYLQF
jgi:hypothetical protein